MRIHPYPREDGLNAGLGTLPPQRAGQANSMLITAGPGATTYECGHWESPALIRRRIDAAVAAERERCDELERQWMEMARLVRPDKLGPLATMALASVDDYASRCGMTDELPTMARRAVTIAVGEAVAAERERCAALAGEYARKWWTEHCRSNRYMETTRKAHDDFCALQVEIRRA